MKGIRFGTYHTYNDFHLILKSKEIGSPEVKVQKIDVQGADSSLDLTEFFGDVKFSNVTLKFDFSTIVPPDQFLSLFSRIKGLLHGRRMHIILDDDPSFFYDGRVFVSQFKNEKNIGTISIECDCEPYKLKNDLTYKQETINGSQAVTLVNSRKRAVPVITTSAAMTIAFGGRSYSSSAGTFTIPELELVEGNNVVNVTGTGTIRFTWQEGSL